MSFKWWTGKKLYKERRDKSLSSGKSKIKTFQRNLLQIKNKLDCLLNYQITLKLAIQRKAKVIRTGFSKSHLHVIINSLFLLTIRHNTRIRNKLSPSLSLLPIRSLHPFLMLTIQNSSGTGSLTAWFFNTKKANLT